MIDGLIQTFLLIIAGIFLYRYHAAIYERLRRFDRANRARIDEQARETQDPLTHFRHTLKLAEEQVEQVSEIVASDARTAEPVTRYLFEGEQFLSRDDAERVRAEKIRALARGYYRELPAALVAREEDGKLGKH